MRGTDDDPLAEFPSEEPSAPATVNPPRKRATGNPLAEFPSEEAGSGSIDRGYARLTSLYGQRGVVAEPLNLECSQDFLLALAPPATPRDCATNERRPRRVLVSQSVRFVRYLNVTFVVLFNLLCVQVLRMLAAHKTGLATASRIWPRLVPWTGARRRSMRGLLVVTTHLFLGRLPIRSMLRRRAHYSGK